MNGYFQTLIDAYTKVLLLPPAEKAKLEEFGTSRQAIIDRIQNRYLYLAQEETRRSNKQKIEDEMKEGMARIDWFNFSIVAKVEFPVDPSIGLEVSIDPATGRRFLVGSPYPWVKVWFCLAKTFGHLQMSRLKRKSIWMRSKQRMKIR